MEFQKKMAAHDAQVSHPTLHMVTNTHSMFQTTHWDMYICFRGFHLDVDLMHSGHQPITKHFSPPRSLGLHWWGGFTSSSIGLPAKLWVIPVICHNHLK